MSTYLASKHADFLASLPTPPVMPIQHGPSDLQALAKHFEKVSEAFVEYVSNIAREAHGCNVEINPEFAAGAIKDAVHDCDLAQAIRSEAERLVERAREYA